MAIAPDDQDDVDDAGQGSKRGDAIRAKMHQLQTKVEILRQEAKQADRLAAEALKRRKLMGQAKVVAGGFLLRIPAAMWTNELRSVFRIGATRCRPSDQDAWSVLLSELEKVWSAPSEGRKTDSTSERASFETGPMQLTPHKPTGAASAPNLVGLASQASEPTEIDSGAVSQEPATELQAPADPAPSQSDASSPPANNPSTAAPAPGLTMELPETPAAPLQDDAPAVPVNPVTAPHPDKGPAAPKSESRQIGEVTREEFLAMEYQERKPYITALAPVLALLTEEDLSRPGIMDSERKKVRALQKQWLQDAGGGA